MELQDRPATNKTSKKDTESRDRNVENQEDIETISPAKKIRFGTYRIPIKCPHCNGQITTRVETRAILRTHITAALLFLTGMWPCIPCVYCSDWCLQHEHYCIRCEKHVGNSTFWNSLKRAPK